MQLIKKYKEKDSNHKSQEILLSVVVPVYNVAPYLERCLDSILTQGVDDMEIICVNDGSTDNSFSILQKYARRYACVRILNQQNGGLVRARKVGLRATLGKYISYIDSDDWIEPGMYKAMLEAIMSNDADIVTSGLIRDYGNYVVEDNENFALGLYEGDKLLYELKYNLIESNFFFKSNINIHITNKLYRRDILLRHQKNVNDEISIGEDAAVVYPVLLDAKRVVIMGQSYYHYCIRSDSMMGHPSHIEAEKNILLSKLLTREFNKHPEVTNGMRQCKNLIAYSALMAYAPSIIKYRNAYLSMYGQINPEEKIVIYGAGRLGQSLHSLLQQAGLNIVAWVDKNEEYLNVTDLVNINFDKILVAVANYDMIETIRQELKKTGVPREKVMVLDIGK